MATPFNLPDMPWVECMFDPQRPRSTDRMEGRRTEGQTVGTPWWTATYKTGFLYEADMGAMDAFMMQAGDDGETFLAYDVFRPRPIAYADAKWPGNHDNLVANGGFEQDFANWTKAASVVTSPDAHMGTKAAKMFRSSSYSSALRSATFPVIGGADYAANAWFKGDAASPDGNYITVWWLREDGSQASTVSVYAYGDGAVTTDWQQYGGTVTAPADAAMAQISLAPANAIGTNSILLIDDVSMTLQTGAGFDGTAVLQAITDSRTVVVSGLPPFFRLSAGDYVEFRMSTLVRSLHRIMENATADAAGKVTLSIKYGLDTQNFTTAAVVNFEKPSCVMQIDPGSYDGKKSWQTRQPSFSATEVFIS